MMGLRVLIAIFHNQRGIQIPSVNVEGKSVTYFQTLHYKFGKVRYLKFQDSKHLSDYYFLVEEDSTASNSSCYKQPYNSSTIILSNELRKMLMNCYGDEWRLYLALNRNTPTHDVGKSFREDLPF